MFSLWFNELCGLVHSITMKTCRIPYENACRTGVRKLCINLQYLKFSLSLLSQTRASEAGYFMPLCDMDRALADIIRIMQEYLDYRVYSVLPLYIRMVKADDLFLSPVNRNRCDGSVVDYYFTVDVSLIWEESYKGNLSEPFDWAVRCLVQCSLHALA